MYCIFQSTTLGTCRWISTKLYKGDRCQFELSIILLSTFGRVVALDCLSFPFIKFYWAASLKWGAALEIRVHTALNNQAFGDETVLLSTQNIC